MKTMNIRLGFGALAVAAALSMAALNSGCIVAAAGGVAAGAGTVAWVEGKLVVTLANPYDNVVRATDQAITQLQFLKVGDARDSLSATLKAHTASDKRVTIDIERQGDQTTKVEIRVDTFGDKALSMTILDRIKANL
jgi:hypothetical protein